MKTLIISTNDPEAIITAKNMLDAGGVIVFPTDTVYGVAASVFNYDAIERIYEIKGRSLEKAIPVLVGDQDQLWQISSSVNNNTRKMIEAFWPGALTLIFPKKEGLPENLSIYPTVGVRMPALPFTLSLLRTCGPLATTSANLSGGENTLSAEDVLVQLEGRIDLLLNGGKTPGMIPSTVVDATLSEVKILREGVISSTQINSILQ